MMNPDNAAKTASYEVYTRCDTYVPRQMRNIKWLYYTLTIESLGSLLCMYCSIGLVQNESRAASRLGSESPIEWWGMGLEER